MTNPNVGWELVETAVFNKDTRVISLPQNFSEEALIITAESEVANDFWYKAGYIQQEYAISGFPKIFAVSQLLGLQSQLVRFNTDLVPYRVSLVRVPWLSDLTCSIYRPIP